MLLYKYTKYINKFQKLFLSSEVRIIKKIKFLIATLVLSSTMLTGCGADINETPEKFKIIDVTANYGDSGVVLLLLDETNNRLTKHSIYDNYKFNVDFKIKSKDDLIGKYFYGNAYSFLKIDTVIKSK